MHKIARLIAVVCALTLFSFELAYGVSWQSLLEEQFSVVETFDNLGNWHGTKVSNGCSSNADDLPRFLDGRPGLWGQYCNWTGKVVGDDWIGNHGFGKQVGTKSVRLWHSGGLSYFNRYYGDGRPQSGYSDMYVFFRAYIPRNAFPTRITDYENKVVGYISGEPYMYTSSGKFVNINTGFTSATGWNYQDPPAHSDRYGDSEVWFHLNAEYDSMRLIFEHRADGRHGSRVQTQAIIKNSDAYFDKLIGIEFHFKLEEPAGNNNGVVEAWIYDATGTPTLLIQNNNVIYRSADGAGHLFNRIQLEGNKHIPSIYIYECGPNMHCTFYLDDFIIDHNRIGPKYYHQMLGTPAPPANLAIVN